MKKITKDALDILKSINPYNGKFADEESYNELYDAMRTLKCFELISDEDFNRIREFDHKAFLDALKEQ